MRIDDDDDSIFCVIIVNLYTITTIYLFFPILKYVCITKLRMHNYQIAL